MPETDNIENRVEEYEDALKAYADLVRKETLIKEQIIAARKRLNDAKDNLREFEQDIMSVLAIRQQAAATTL